MYVVEEEGFYFGSVIQFFLLHPNLLKFGFQDHSSGSENDRKDSASQPSNQSDTGKQGLGPLGNPIAVHTAVKVGTGQPPSTCLRAFS